MDFEIVRPDPQHGELFVSHDVNIKCGGTDVHFTVIVEYDTPSGEFNKLFANCQGDLPDGFDQRKLEDLLDADAMNWVPKQLTFKS
jgi:hypothetical protein